MKAVTVEVFINKSGRKLGLRFSTSPGEDIQKQLRERGFVPDGDNIWKAANTREKRAFADTLKASIEEVKEELLSLPYQPSSENIDLRYFSYITFNYTGEDGKLLFENFIIFEPSKPKAQVIVNEFGRRRYGHRFKNSEVYSRNYQREARKLLADGKVIKKLPGVSGTEEPMVKAGVSPEPQQQSPKETLTNEHGIYTRKTAGDRYELIKIPVPASAKYEASIELVKTETGEYAFGLSHSKLFGNQSSKGFAPGMAPDRYPDRIAALRHALMFHIERLEEQIGKEESILGNEALKNKRLQKAAEAIYAYAKSLEIDMPEVTGKYEEVQQAKPDDQVKKIEERVSSEEYDHAANYLDTLLRQIQEGQNHQLLSFAVVTAKKQKLKKLMSKRGWDNFSKLITAESFRDELKVNLWDLIPSAWKKEQAIQRIDRKADPADEDLKSLLVKFTSEVSSESDVRKEMMGVFFDIEGIVATDAKKLLFIHHPSEEAKGLFCITKKCWHALAIANEPAHFEEIEKEKAEAFRKSVNYPDYKEVIPHEDVQVVTVNAISLITYLQALKESGMWYGKRIAIIRAAYITVGFEIDLLYESVAAMVRLGHTDLDFGINGHDKTVLITPKGQVAQAHELKTDFALAMPYLLDNIIKGEDARGFMYFDLETGEAKTFGVEGAPCPCEVKEVKKEEPADTDKEAKPDKLPEEPKKEELEELPPNSFLGENPVTEKQYAWEMSQDQFQEIMAIRKTGSPVVLNAHDKRIHEALVIWAAQNGKPIAPANLEVYPEVAVLISSTAGVRSDDKEDQKLPPEEFLPDLQQLVRKDEFPDHQLPEIREGWEMTRQEFMEMTAARKTGNPSVVDIRDGELHEEMVKWALRHGKNVPPEVLEDYPGIHEWLKRELNSEWFEKKLTHQDRLNLVIAHMHEMYAEGKRATKGQIERLAGELNVPNLGMMWEAVELSWLLWYRMLYKQTTPFEARLGEMIRFWNKVQPTYAYSDSSKELYRQYSTPCPIGAIIAQYTWMDQAKAIYEPSAGNGLLLLGADPSKSHVNEIDSTRLESLRFQRFKTITNYNAAEPFPSEMDKAYDVVVTNPPFSKWEDDKYDKREIIRRYFHNQVGLASNIRLEHMMAGLALHCMKDSGRAAIIIMGHIYFGNDGYIAKYRPFFNWLYRHYKVDDVINMNSFKLYNKQGAIEKTMLILIGGRKLKPEGVSPRKEQAPYLENMVDSFEELWERVSRHSGYTLEMIITQLKIALGK